MSEFWNNRYGRSEYAYGTLPNQFFRQTLDRLGLAGGRALFPADGEGRNSAHAASLGFQVLAFDISSEGSRKALALAEARGVEVEYIIGSFEEVILQREHAPFDLVVLTFAHFNPDVREVYHKALARLLAPGGHLILEGFSKDNLAYRSANPAIGGPPVEELLFTAEQIASDFSDLQHRLLEETVVELHEGLYHVGKGSVVRFVGQKGLR